jgi:hypothetical protein
MSPWSWYCQLAPTAGRQCDPSSALPAVPGPAGGDEPADGSSGPPRHVLDLVREVGAVDARPGGVGEVDHVHRHADPGERLVDRVHLRRPVAQHEHAEVDPRLRGTRRGVEGDAGHEHDQRDRYRDQQTRRAVVDGCRAWSSRGPSGFVRFGCGAARTGGRPQGRRPRRAGAAPTVVAGRALRCVATRGRAPPTRAGRPRNYGFVESSLFVRVDRREVPVDRPLFQVIASTSARRSLTVTSVIG